MIRRKSRLLLTTALGAGFVVGWAGLQGIQTAQAAEKTLDVGITLPLTGADAEGATRIKDGAVMAFEEANAKHEVPGYTFNTVVLDNGTPTAGQYDLAQAATNAKKLVSDPNAVANVGPMMSGSGKAMSPIFSEGDFATITPSSTNPDITDPKFAGEYRPKGQAVYFRTVTTDTYQGPEMANFYKKDLHVKSVYVLDDSGAYGVGMSNLFEKEAKKVGIKVLGHDELNPQEADYTVILTKIKALHPDAIYFGGVSQAGVKLMKQAYDVIPNVIKGGGDGVYSPDMLKGGGFPAAQGWYATIASPHVLDESAVKGWVARFTKRFGTQPDDYAITAYDAGVVIVDAARDLAKSGKPINHETMRNEIQREHVKTLQGEIAFDNNGDMLDKVVSVFQIRHDPKYPAGDILHQFHYIGVAPETAVS